MNGINLQCILDFLERNNHVPEYIDNTPIATVIYYFPDNITEAFGTNSCISITRTLRILTKFSLQNQLAQLQQADCLCN